MSEVKVKSINCPVCGAPLELKDNGYGDTECQYCHALLFLSRDDTTEEGFIEATNNGRSLAFFQMPIGWDITNTRVEGSNPTIMVPYLFTIELENNMNSIIHIQSGEGFHEDGPISYINRQARFTNQRDFVSVKDYIDNIVESYARNNDYEITNVEQRELPIGEHDKKKDYEKYLNKTKEEMQRQSNMYGCPLDLVGCYKDSDCRVYSLEGKDKKKVAFYTSVEGNKVLMTLMAGLNSNINNLFGGFGGMFGGMMGANQLQNNASQSAENIEGDFGFGNLNKPGQGEILEWRSDTLFMLVSSEEEFENVYEKAFKDICSTFELSEMLLAEYASMKAEMEQINNTQYANEQMQQQQYLNTLDRMSKQISRNAQANMEAMMARSNKQYEAQRASYNSRMAAQDRMRDKRSEAIRGVNTYIRPDGKEVEVPVSADTAWINEKGDIVGGTPGFNPGYGWTQMEKKY